MVDLSIIPKLCPVCDKEMSLSENSDPAGDRRWKLPVSETFSCGTKVFGMWHFSLCYKDGKLHMLCFIDNDHHMRIEYENNKTAIQNIYHSYADRIELPVAPILRDYQLPTLQSKLRLLQTFQ